MEDDKPRNGSALPSLLLDESQPAQRTAASGLLCGVIGVATSLSLMASPALANNSPSTVRATQDIGKPSPPPKQSSSTSSEPEKVSPVRSALNGILGKDGPIGTPAAPNTTAGGGSTGLAERR
ncbi:hypothetical protein WJX84_002757 [Apatococcus fuscideae]|uniref:Uncharacterized protein n=1 Tax=Apatococcus fuscideae TaxID=2026836 RepID=A0AAW1S4J2_9CHLO